MKSLSFILSVSLLAASLCTAQEAAQKYWIYFAAKDHLSLTKSSSPSVIAAVTGISERAVQRRAKMSAAVIALEDLPVSATYLNQLRSRGIAIQNTSRWFNAATAYLTEAQRISIQALPFVRAVEPVVTLKRKEPSLTGEAQPSLSKQTSGKFSYGFSETQMNVINAIPVHNIGISGRGVLMGMLDTGFRWKLHEAMKNMRVIAEYDFIQKDGNTANGAGDSGSQDSHGTSCLSLVGAFNEGTLVSPAFNAQFMLGKTEYVPSETNVEEDNWVAAIEWMEMSGVDIVSSSLGYKDFDAGQKSYVYADMNGATAITSIAATIAARKGVVVCNAMGNEGSGVNPPSITSPADADSIISVGAVDRFGTIASFSSNGPTSDGRMKPDVSAQGVSVYAAKSGGSYSGSFGGTSAATPLTAGVAAMILSARPELTPIQVRTALRSTASKASSPDNIMGWGIINAYQAVLYHGMVIGTDPEITATLNNNLMVEIFVVSKSAIFQDSIRIFYTVNDGASFTSLPMTLTEVTDTATNSGKYSVFIPQSAVVPKFYVRAVDATNAPRTSPFAAPAELYDATPGMLNVHSSTAVPAVFTLHQNYPNPFNPSTIISYDIPRTGFVTVKVFDLLGREVRTIVSGIQSPRTYAVSFDASGLAAGVYLYRVQLDDRAETRRMLLLK